MPFILALDQGTTSSRAIVFDHGGQIRSVAQQEFEQLYPQPGWVEHDPQAIWDTQSAVAAEALAEAGLAAEDIAGIGLTNQRETTVLWERATGRPVHNAIVWQDRRTADFCERLKANGLEPLFQEKTGLRLDPYFSGTKLRWLLDHVDGARSKAARGELAFGTVDAWILWHLTGGALHATDATNASRTLLYNLHTNTWDEELLDALDIPPEVLPEVRPSSGVYAETAGDLFDKRMPIAGVAGDQQAALFGQVCTEPGRVKGTYGTGAFLLQNTGTEPAPSAHDLLTTVAWQLEGEAATYALEGSIFIAGAVVQWLRDGLGLIRSAQEVEALAGQVEDTGGVYLVPAFTGLGAPHWDPHARGLISGITRGTTAAHLARAALESIAYQTADVVRALEADSGLALDELRVDGGAAQNDLLLQLMADLLGVPVVRPAVLETTALGAAYLAGLATGFWESQDEIAAQWQADRRLTPQSDRADTEERLAGWHRAVARTRSSYPDDA